ncbi:MAG TPA: hypothetical protein VK795_00130 [Terriglobales bacterium]|nr:hypothetical protein [Terriglobales bacterium]
MKMLLGQIKTVAISIVEKAKVGKGLLAGLAVFFVFQLYFVRELLAAELLFGAGFGVLLVLGGLAYLVGSLGERGLDFAEVGVRVIGDSARRGFSALEEISRKPFRHPRSESAQ